MWRYPVKSFGGQRLDEAVIESDGLRGDHLWAVVDAESGAVATAKKFRRFGVLLTCGARLLGDTDPRDRAALELTLPGGEVLAGDDPGVDDALSELTGTSVRLESRTRTYDAKPLHLLSRSAVEALGVDDPVEVALRRFRPQLVFDTPDSSGFVEDEWIGRKVSIGASVLVEPTVRTARCVMVTLPHREVSARKEMLRRVGEANLVPTEPGRNPAPCIGVYASVVSEGPVAVGDVVGLR